MSRIGKQPIQISDGVTVTINKQDVLVKGPKGELSYQLPKQVAISEESGQLNVSILDQDKHSRALWGLWRSLLANAVEGVSIGFSKELKLVGVGYNVQRKGDSLELEVGYSHKVEYTPPEGVEIEIEKGAIKIIGVDKQVVGQVAANIRRARPPEPYKGKGIRYSDEVVKIKPGKSAAGATV